MTAVHGRRAVRGVGASALLAGALACSPALDWREVRPPALGVAALFPCKPTTETRTVALAGGPARMTLLACTADGATFGLAAVDAGGAVRADAVRDALLAAQVGNFGAQAASPAAPASVPGVGRAERRNVTGRRPDGEPVRQHLLSFTRGAWVYQASVTSPGPATAELGGATDAFFDGVRVVP